MKPTAYYFHQAVLFAAVVAAWAAYQRHEWVWMAVCVLVWLTSTVRATAVLMEWKRQRALVARLEAVQIAELERRERRVGL